MKQIIRNISSYERFEEIVNSMRDGANLSFDQGIKSNPIDPKITAISRNNGIYLYVIKGSGLIDYGRLTLVYKTLAKNIKNNH